MQATIAVYQDDVHREGVVRLWRQVFNYPTQHNDPDLVIDRKQAVADGLLFVALLDGQVIGTSMAGYDGHRGWLYSIAVSPDHQRLGIGRALVLRAEEALITLGCVKINLQIIAGNDAVAGFYQRLGYDVEPRISMGKRLPRNLPGRGHS